MFTNFFISIFISGLLALFSSVSANFEFFNGTWEGRGHQGDINSNWNIKYVIDGHEKKFNYSHSDLECGGMSTLQNVSKNSVIFIEKVTFGNRCVDNGKTELRKIDNDTIKYIWYYKDGKQGAEGVLKRKLSLVAHYKLDGNALDASVNKNHGSVFQAKPTVDRNGLEGGALSFDGVDDYVTIPNSENINFSKDQDFTVSVWAKPSPLQENTLIVYNPIVDKWAIGDKGYPYVIRYWNQSSGKNHGKVEVARYDLRNKPYPLSKKTIKDDKFHHLVYSKKGKELYLYIDGVLDTCFEDASIDETRSASSVQFGRQGVGKNGNWGYFKGVIDDVRFYNYSLSPIQINKLYSSVNTNPELTENHICPKSVDELVEEIEELQVVDFEIPFEGNHWRIQESAKEELDKLGKVLSSNKLTSGSFELVGHVSGVSGNNKTCIDDNHKFVRNSRYAKECWKTDADWAMALSERRANSVKNYLVDNFSFDKNRIKAYGVGNTQHKISDPDNPGNRRVEVKYIKNK